VQAMRLMDLYSCRGIGPDRVYIKLASTWEGVEACRKLQKQGVDCNMTLLFSFGQVSQPHTATYCCRAPQLLVPCSCGALHRLLCKPNGPLPLSNAVGISSPAVNWRVRPHTKPCSREKMLGFPCCAMLCCAAGCCMC
jgi:hypothetical protein